ncbi:MAG: hypothetical protein D6795_09390 [Deltaproteobacteria bacterium]|nr:MAG: hypothetical protein D6795_09390 [Deltaproteobacteria bacterium]
MTQPSRGLRIAPLEGNVNFFLHALCLILVLLPLGGCRGKSELQASVNAGATHLRIFHTNNVQGDLEPCG